MPTLTLLVRVQKCYPHRKSDKCKGRSSVKHPAMTSRYTLSD